MASFGVQPIFTLGGAMFHKILHPISAVFVLAGMAIAMVGHGISPTSQQATARAKEAPIQKHTDLTRYANNSKG